MRRLPIVTAVAALGLLAALALPHAPSCLFAPARVALRVAARAVAAVTAPAFAQEVLEFKPIPAESAAAIERRRAIRRAQRAAERARAGAPAAPAPDPESTDEPGIHAVPPVPPVPPTDPVRVEISRSGNIMRVGNDITIEEDQTVVGDVLAVGGDVIVHGHVEGDVVSMGGDIRLEETARVDGDVVCMGGSLHEEEGAVVGGQRVTAAGGRDVRRRLVDRDDHEGRSDRRLAGALIWAAITLGLAWMFASLAPGRTGNAVEMVRREPGASTLVGFLALLLAGPAFLVIIILGALLCITIIGIPLALAAWVAYGVLVALTWIWGYVVGVTVIGQAIQSRRAPAAAGPPVTPGAPPAWDTSLVRSALIGVAVFSGAFVLSRLFKMLPGFGGLGTLIAVMSWIATGVFTMIGAGALIRNEWQSGSLLRRFRRRPADGGAGTAAPAQWYPAPAAPTGTPPPPPMSAPPPSAPPPGGAPTIE